MGPIGLDVEDRRFAGCRRPPEGGHDLLRPRDHLAISLPEGGTYSGLPLAMAAVIAAIEEYEREDGAVFRHIARMGTLLKEGLEQIAADHEQPLVLQGFPGAWSFTFHAGRRRIRNQAEGRGADFGKTGRFAELLKERGVLTSLRFCTSAAHTGKDVGDTLDRASEAMRILEG